MNDINDSLPNYSLRDLDEEYVTGEIAGVEKAIEIAQKMNSTHDIISALEDLLNEILRTNKILPSSG